MKKKRDLSSELNEGFVAPVDRRVDKHTLRMHTVKVKAAPTLLAEELVALREHMNLSRELFARYLRTNVRTLENWERGRASPNRDG